MIVCSCTVITDGDVEGAVIAILNRPQPMIPTPGLVFRELGKRMNCCGCAPLAVDTIYRIMERLEQAGRVCPCACATARDRLHEISRRQRRTLPRGTQNGRDRATVDGRGAQSARLFE